MGGHGRNLNAPWLEIEIWHTRPLGLTLVFQGGDVTWSKPWNGNAILAAVPVDGWVRGEAEGKMLKAGRRGDCPHEFQPKRFAVSNPCLERPRLAEVENACIRETVPRPSSASGGPAQPKGGNSEPMGWGRAESCGAAAGASSPAQLKLKRPPRPHLFWLPGCLGVRRNKFVVWTDSKPVIHHPRWILTRHSSHTRQSYPFQERALAAALGSAKVTRQILPWTLLWFPLYSPIPL